MPKSVTVPVARAALDEPLPHLAQGVYVRDVDPEMIERPRSNASIAAVVLDCRAELAGVAAAALPELLERLARQRLHEHPTNQGADEQLADGC
jgi:hypothetical protein